MDHPILPEPHLAARSGHCIRPVPPTHQEHCALGLDALQHIAQGVFGPLVILEDRLSA